jgi:predicted DCC family thiol-disulfide oxidoreductase YuxK
MKATGPVLLYDGLCGFCDGTVQFVLARDRKGAIRFATLQGDHGRAVLARHGELKGVDSLVLVDDRGVEGERVLVRSEAILWLARYLGGGWRVLNLIRILPQSLRDALYDVFARYRYRLFGRYESCALPDEAQRARFID